MKICVGGTFNVLHKGHKYLLDISFKKAGGDGLVYIGVSAGKLVLKKKKIKPFTFRVKVLSEYLKDKGYENRTVIKKINDKYGFAVEQEFDAIIVSPETIYTAEKINKKRIKLGKNPLSIIKIPYVLAEDQKPISSTRILNNEIDADGRIIN
jgi:pantetheine-phosphate adenylyltransferase